MLSEDLAKKLSYQLNREIYSGYLYLGMASYADSIGLKGFANWFKHQFDEEYEHAMKFYDYLQSKDVRVMMEDIETPPQEFTSASELFEKTLAHEKVVSKLINDLVDVAKAENDTDTQKFLDWFVKEQIEEEATPAGIIKKIDEVGRDEEGLAKVDILLLNRK